MKELTLDEAIEIAQKRLGKVEREEGISLELHSVGEKPDHYLFFLHEKSEKNRQIVFWRSYAVYKDDGHIEHVQMLAHVFDGMYKDVEWRSLLPGGEISDDCS